ncbi:Phage upper baseplate protein [Listeria grandensis FSL F6-0971]|uniref:Phage upper baseplate protein n=1 Tax=Listeria grandensis FSL F6-0971 TaxID=1265819 RepID=W7BEJ3_9LIST|nr:glycosyl hydrolase family 28-related protein [Listeria grandensis]EUJ23235.1 Phage upper baseplate protein [Listeria grandensis FSL F6-0971]
MYNDTILDGAVVNVKDVLFGAKGDGKTDDTVAIQAAIDALFASPVGPSSTVAMEGGIVFFPPGEYVITKPIYVVNTGIKLIGASPVASLIVPRGELVTDSSGAKKVLFDGIEEGNAVIEIKYINKEGKRTFMRNLNIQNLGFDLRNVNKTTMIRAIRPYDLCHFENLMFVNIRGTAIACISEYPDNAQPEPKGLGQGLVLRDIHIDNSSTVLDSLKNGQYVTFNKLIDRGRPQDATLPAIYLENINESYLDGVKVNATGVEVDMAGNIIRDAAMQTKISYAPRSALLMEGCQGVNIHMSSFNQLSKAAIDICKGTMGKQRASIYNFIGGNTFEEITECAIRMNGGVVTDGAGKNVSNIIINENRILGNRQPEYVYQLDHCDLITIHGRASVKIGSNALNTTIYASDINKASSDNSILGERKIVDEGQRTLLIGREYRFDNYTQALVINSVVKPGGLELPVDERATIERAAPSNAGKIAIVQENNEDKLFFVKKCLDGTYQWARVQSELVYTDYVTPNKYKLSTSYITGTYIGNVTKLRVLATNRTTGAVIEKAGGEFFADGTFRFYYKAVLNNTNYDVKMQVVSRTGEIFYITGLEIEY